MEINKTLLMGKTNFEMRGNLPQKEPIFLKNWENDDVYHAMLKKREGCEEYILHDGPPYANGDMHCGHMLNRILKDIILRYKNMSGYSTPFYPGWDTHGLPIENAVTKSGVNRKTMAVSEFRTLCEGYAQKQIQRQMAQVKRLGVNADFENRYVTLTKDFEKNEIHVFATMALKGLIYKGLKPVYWSPSSESALAEAEIEYADVKATTIYVKFPVKDGKGILDPKTDSFIIWTTTPWTMPANLAICLNQKLEYGLFKTEKGNFVFLTCLADQLKQTIGFEECTLLKTFKGKELEGIVATHPLYNRDSIIILGDHVTPDAGTGCVHTAPGHGADDYVVGVKYHLPPFCPVDDHGYMMKECGPRLEGMFYDKANEEVLVWLEEVGALLHKEEIVHSYPHDWRTHKPVIFRATPQWFCSIDKIRNELIDAIEKVNWTPSWGKQRMINMMKDRTDWCISRQRVWGVPIPIIYNEDGSPIMEKEVFDHIEELIGKYGSNVWFDREAKDLLPEGYKNDKSPNGLFRKEKDIMDVWFDSGSSFFTEIDRGYKYPVDLYLEGSDQYRGWFNSSLIVSVAMNGVAPYRNVLSHGFIVDEKGMKMSKSLGNGVDPNKIINVYGADCLRLWTASVNYQADAKMSENLVKKVSDTYRKIRNTFKFLLGNLSDGEGAAFNPDVNMAKEYGKISTYVLASLEATKNKCLDYYDSYDFANVLQELLTFLIGDCSAFYLSITKDTLYCDSKNAKMRKEVQSVIYQITETLSRILAPILPFTMDEVYQNIPYHKEKHIFLEDMPKRSSNYDAKLLDEFNAFKAVRDDVLKGLEEARSAGVIGSSQEACVALSPKTAKELYQSLTKDELKFAFITSDATVEENVEGTSFDNATVKVSHHTGCKCERCWNYFDNLVEVEDAHVCARCQEVIKDVE